MKRGLLTVPAVLAALPLLAAVEFGTPFSDNAVLQREREIPVWGRADAGTDVEVSFAGRTVAAKADADGRWRVKLPALSASKENRTLVAVARKDGRETGRAEAKNVLVGEVWFASGQSNMELPIWFGHERFRDRNGGLMVAMTHLPNIRIAWNPHVWSVEPRFGYRSDWRPLVPASFADGRWCSAIAFYFARELYLALDVPIGIVESSWGGTSIDPWTPRCGYEDCDPSIRATADYAVKAKFDKAKDAVGPITSEKQQPTVLWNGMVEAWCPMAMRGLIWYQGCSNASGPEAYVYCAKMHALYNGWSRMFGNPDMKLYFCQLAPYRWNRMALILQQTKFAAEEPHAAIVATADVGNFDDIHPNEKEIVARRLAVHALKRDYGFDIPEDDSPVLRSATYGNGEVKLAFDHVRSWYVYAPDRSVEPAFEVAGRHGGWKPAKLLGVSENGAVTGTVLTVRSEEVKEPVMVRYLGRNRSMGTLFNEVSLPLGPFQDQKK